MKSLAVKLDTYLSMSKPLVKFTVTVSSTTARDREVIVTAVLPRLRPRLAQAMAGREDRPAPLWARRFPEGRRDFLPAPSVYRTASMGETLAATRPGRWQDRSTVNRANRAEPKKSAGLTDTTPDTPSRWEMITGVSCPPMSHPARSPRGMPRAERARAWYRMIRFS